MNKKISMLVGAVFTLAGAQAAHAACSDIAASHADFVSKIQAAAVASTAGYGLPMWVTAVDETGKVCFVGTTGSEDLGKSADFGGTYAGVPNDFSENDGAYAWNNSVATGTATSNQQWLGSRIISAQKANTANAFSRNAYAISTANLHNAVSEGGSLYGLQHSNPVDASRAYLGSPLNYGKKNDPITNKRIGGVNVFGGGLALYKAGGVKVGAIGVSGDTSCRDHAFAWEVRHALGGDNLVFGITNYNADSGHNVQAAIPAGDAYVLRTAANTVPVGDEMVIDLRDDKTGLASIVGKTNYLVDPQLAYWHSWSQPSCPLVNGSHEAYIFIQQD